MEPDEPGDVPRNRADAGLCRVLVSDAQPVRLRLITLAIERCNAAATRLSNLTATGASTDSCLAAVVPLHADRSRLPDDLRTVRALVGNGFHVVCYGDGVSQWPLGIRCQPLLAGACLVLDSAGDPFVDELALVLGDLLQSVRQRQGEEEQCRRLLNGLGIVGSVKVMRELFSWVCRISPLSDLPVLLQGETGTGKELFARAIHQLDPKRRDGPFVAVNCAAINIGVAESEFFGHRRGAFTGADRDRKGLFRTAHGGVLFLDEIGDLEPALQAKLLRVLQENRVHAVGDDRDIAVNVRIIAATHRDLEDMVAASTFRADLFHRLNVLACRIPPLRERPSDIALLVEHLLAKLAFTRGPVRASEELLRALEQLDFPGNVRELENVLQRAATGRRTDGWLGLADLPAGYLRQLATAAAGAVPDTATPAETAERASSTPGAVASLDPAFILEANDWSLPRSMRYCERRLMEEALEAARGNHSRAARMLGITPRSVYNKVRKYGLDS
jgi:transcriptional regulator with GAF, ATPase, and Fis domain